MTIPRYIDPDDFMPDEAVWQFCTPRFRVVMFAEPEDMDPADSFEFDDDIEAVRSGAVEWFSASVVVYGPDGKVWGRDDLGGCAYERIRRDFVEAHWRSSVDGRNTLAMKARNTVICHYFPDMVRTAIAEAKARAISLQFVEG
jgi:hypothetical protein